MKVRSTAASVGRGLLPKREQHFVPIRYLSYDCTRPNESEMPLSPEIEDFVLNIDAQKVLIFDLRSEG